jgi:hypothetical protein
MNKFSRDLVQGMQEAAAFVKGKKGAAAAAAGGGRRQVKSRIPNEETTAAMREARAGKLPRFESTKDLLRELNQDD